ncbi:hypothetical protein Tco_0145439 [Tanacetum coccineum]
MMKGSDIGIQEKKAKLFNEWERFTSTDRELIESYYHRFSKLMNDFKRNKHFSEKIASNLKFLNNLQPEWKRHVTIVHQTKDLHENGIIVIPGIANQNANQIGNGNVVAAQAEGNANGNNGDLDKIEEVNANCILMANLQQASTSGTQTDKASVYDSYGSAEQYTDLLEPIPEPHQIQQNNSDVTFMISSVEQNGGTVEQNPAIVEETRSYFESLYNSLAIEVEKVNSVNRKMKETNVELTTELARYKNQEKFFEINQKKYDKLERCYQKSVYQEQFLTKKINALYLSSAKTITTLNEEIANLNNMLSKEKSIVSSLQKEKKRLKSDFKIREDEFLDKQILLENKIKELDNILVKTGQSIQTMHMLSPKPDSCCEPLRIESELKDQNGISSRSQVERPCQHIDKKCLWSIFEKVKWTYELKRKATWRMKINEPEFDFGTDMWSVCLKEKVGIFSLLVKAKFPHLSRIMRHWNKSYQDVAEPSLSVKLLRGAASRDTDFISGLAMRRAANAVNWFPLILLWPGRPSLGC